MTEITIKPQNPAPRWKLVWDRVVRLFTSIRFLTAWVVGGGILLRLWHYIVNHTIWYDEAVLLDNVLTKDFVGLLGPLRNEVAAPPLYLWYHRVLAITLGDHAYLWRLLPFLASTAVLVLMVP